LDGEPGKPERTRDAGRNNGNGGGQAARLWNIVDDYTDINPSALERDVFAENNLLCPGECACRNGNGVAVLR
jgi:hypothetical protein